MKSESNTTTGKQAIAFMPWLSIINYNYSLEIKRFYE